MKRVGALAGAAWACALLCQPALAEEKCGSKVTHKFGEIRATFGDMLAGCDKSGACYASTSKVDKSQAANFSQQLRFLQAPGGGKLGMRFTAVEPMAKVGATMDMQYSYTQVDLTREIETRGNVVNDYYLRDADKADRMAREMTAKSTQLRWSYTPEKGELVTVEFSLRGATKALAWIACMAKP